MALYVKQGKTPIEQRQQLREVSATVAEILMDVETKGNNALYEYSERFDKWKPHNFQVSEAEISQCLAEVSAEDKEIISYAQTLIRKTAQAQLASLQPETIPGAHCRHSPCSRG